MPDIILHHYPPSPVAEKVRTGLGLKKLAWHSVEQNRLPDRPELLAMTGGYRRIPVMQIGSDIYCDTQAILRELDRRHPEPTFFPGGGYGMPYAVSRWTDECMFPLVVRTAFTPDSTPMAPEVAADRQRLYLGPDGSFEKEAADMPHNLAQLRAHLGWFDERLSAGGRDFALGDAPGMPDLMVWYLVWFFRTRYGGADQVLSEFQALLSWADRMAAIGHGTQTDMSPADALAIANGTEPATPPAEDPYDPQGLKVGMTASVAPLGDTGESPVTGTIRSVSRDTIALDRYHELCGDVTVHFPRVGYRVTPN